MVGSKHDSNIPDGWECNLEEEFEEWYVEGKKTHRCAKNNKNEKEFTIHILLLW